MKPPATSELPYTDTKTQGSPDFYFAINATFRYLLGRQGHEGWRRYLEEMGRGYFAPVNRQWAQGGLDAVAARLSGNIASIVITSGPRARRRRASPCG